MFNEASFKLHGLIDTTTGICNSRSNGGDGMADRIVVMKGPHSTSCLSEEIYDEPANLFVANFISPPMNFLNGHIKMTKL